MCLRTRTAHLSQHPDLDALAPHTQWAFFTGTRSTTAASTSVHPPPHSARVPEARHQSARLHRLVPRRIPRVWLGQPPPQELVRLGLVLLPAAILHPSVSNPQPQPLRRRRQSQSVLAPTLLRHALARLCATLRRVQQKRRTWAPMRCGMQSRRQQYGAGAWAGRPRPNLLRHR